MKFGYSVAQTSESAVSPISQSAGPPVLGAHAGWKPAIQQTRRSALRYGALLKFGFFAPLLTATLQHSFAADAPHSGAGYTYRHETVSEVPWSIHILKIDRSNHDLRLQTVLANG